MDIFIEKQPYSETRHTAGYFTDNAGDEYEFTITDYWDDNSAFFELELNWVNDKPDLTDIEEIEDNIKNHYSNTQN